MKNKNSVREIAHHIMVPVWASATVFDAFYFAMPKWATMIVFPLQMMLMLYCIIFGWTHGRSLCLMCMKNTPDNPERSIRKRARTLRTFHWLTEHLMWVVVGWAATMVFNYFILWLTDIEWVAHWGQLPLDIYCTAFLFVVAVHQRLEPWCPQCKDWEDDGDPEIVPDPMPQGEKQR